MSHHSPTGCGENSGIWLPLIEYSVRSGLSLSTIRRKIKSNSLQYRMENGRYLILFEDSGRPASFTAPVMKPTVSTAVPVEERRPEFDSYRPAPSRVEVTRPTERDALFDADHGTNSAVESAVRMVSEAYEHALREKDERIHLLEKSNRELEERLSELRLLVKVLEEKYEVRY